MSIKFNWGTGIFIFIGLFLLSMAFVVYQSFQQKNDLVEKEYYPQGLEYQKQIDRTANTGTLSGSIGISQQQGKLVIKYPTDLRGKDVIGQVYLFRPSDQDADFRASIMFDTAMIQFIPLDKLLIGKYIAKFSWKMEGREFYHEQSVMIGK